VADGVAATAARLKRQRDHIVVPSGIDVRRVGLVHGGLSIAEIPYDMVGRVVDDIAGQERGEIHVAAVLAHHRNIRRGHEVDFGLRRGDDIVPDGGGIFATLWHRDD